MDPMATPLDLDQLQTFVAISDAGSFTRAADEVHKTQSAVSMQMRRLEERIGKTLFEKDGRNNRLTEDGEKAAQLRPAHVAAEFGNGPRLRRHQAGRAYPHRHAR
jgi:DNA-binding transcriptional LysR family regulator